MRRLTPFFRQDGTSTLEASLFLIPVLFVCLLGIELVQVHQIKQLAALALHEAGRAASVNTGNSNAINKRFAQALLPRFAPAGRHLSTAQRRDATLARYRSLYKLPLWQIQATEFKPQRLRLDLIYLHEPMQPWLRQLLKISSVSQDSTQNNLVTQARRHGLIAIRLTHQVVLHSDELQRAP